MAANKWWIKTPLTAHHGPRQNYFLLWGVVCAEDLPGNPALLKEEPPFCMSPFRAIPFTSKCKRKKREVALCKDMWWLDVPEIKIVVNSWNPEGETDSAWMNSKALSKRAIHFLAVWKLRKLAGEGLPGICFLKEDFCWESPDQGYPSDVPCSRLGRAEVWVEFPFLPSAPCDSEHLFNLLGLRFPWVKWK